MPQGTGDGPATGTLTTTGGSPHRRRGDWASSPTMIDTVRFLISRPQVDQLAQFLVLHIFKRHAPVSAVISVCDPDGSLRAVSTFGNPPGGNEAYRSLSLWDAMPISAAVRTDDIVVVHGDALAADYPGIAQRMSPAVAVAAIPLQLPGEPVGALQMSLGQLPDDVHLEEDLGGVTAILALYLDLMLHPNGMRRNGEATPSREGKRDHGHAAPSHLTERQVEILGFMASGLTNAQIAARIGFSESTVRQETMAIYRFLGVEGRQEAAAAARARGLV